MSEWQYLDEPGIRSCQAMYRNHYGDHDIGYESVVHPGSVDDFECVRLNRDELINLIWISGLLGELPEVKALVVFALECHKRFDDPKWHYSRGLTPDDTRDLDVMAQAVTAPFTEPADAT